MPSSVACSDTWCRPRAAVRGAVRPAIGVTVALLLLAARGDAQGVFSQRRALEDAYRQQLAELADDCQRQGLVEAAEQLSGWVLPSVTKGQTLYMPRLSDERSGAAAAETPVPTSVVGELTWRQRWQQLRTAHAERLWRLADEVFVAGDYDAAFRLAYQVLREDPAHAAAGKIVRLDGATPPVACGRADPAFRVRPSRTRHPKYGWKPHEHWRLESPHYLLVTNAGPVAGQQLICRLETLHAAWYQLFRRFVDSDAALTGLWQEGRKPRRPRTRHRVVMFADRSEYIDQLQAVEPQIAVSQGVYRSADQAAFFYAGDSVSPSIWMHEATHQLFHELGHARGQVGLIANFWIVEGIAVYLESLRFGEGYCSVGGVDAERLQYARYRLFSEDFYVRLADLILLGRESLQQDPRIRRLYSQSAGLAHMLMDRRDGVYRGPLIRYLRTVYDRRDDRHTLSDMTGVPLEQLDTEYAEFLQVDDGDLAAPLACGAARQLCLARTHVSDRGLDGIASLTQLEWLDVTGCRVGDRTILSLSNRAPLRQVNLEATAVSDAALAHLATYETLEELDLSQTRITDAGLKHLAGLRNLKVLWLTGTGVTDAGVVDLLRLQNLEMLELSRTKVSAAAEQRVRDALPKLRASAGSP